MKPEETIPSDTFQCLGLDDLGKAIGEMEKTGGREWTMYSHTEGLASPGWIARMNPPYSMLYPLKDCDWSRVHVYRLCLQPINPGSLPDFPGEDREFQRILLRNITRHLGELYDFQRIGRFAKLSTAAHLPGLLGDLGRRWARWKLSRPLPQPISPINGRPTDVCSGWWTDRLEDSVRECYDLPGFDLIPGVPRENRRPADVPKSPYLLLQPFS